jgi:hypothetical protein
MATGWWSRPPHRLHRHRRLPHRRLPLPRRRLPVPETFTPESRVHDVVERLGVRGRELLRKHGYEVGEGFVDVLSQYQTLEHAYRTERLRNLNDMLAELNSAQ